MSKILVTTPNKNVGGVYHFVKNIVPCFDCTIHIFKRGRLFVGQKRNPFDLILLPIRFISTLIKSKSNKIIINTSLSKGNLLRDGLLVFLSKLLRRKTLLIIHGFQEKALKNKTLLRLGYFQADAIIVLADEFKEKLIEAGYKKEIYIQFNPVQNDILNIKSNRDINRISDLLFISRIEKEKGIYIAIDTFRILKERYANMKLHIAGDGTELENIKEYINSHNINDVIFYGYVKDDEKLKLLKETDAFIFPTAYKEGLPISVLEAMAAGQLVITRPVGGLVDLYKDCDYGIMTLSLNATEYVEAYENLISQDGKMASIRNNNILFAKNNFAPQIIADKIIKILDSL